MRMVQVNLPNIIQGKDTLYLDDKVDAGHQPLHRSTAKRMDGTTTVWARQAKVMPSDISVERQPRSYRIPNGKDATYYGIQSSWAYFKRGAWMDAAWLVITCWEQVDAERPQAPMG